MRHWQKLAYLRQQLQAISGQWPSYYIFNCLLPITLYTCSALAKPPYFLNVIKWMWFMDELRKPYFMIIIKIIMIIMVIIIIMDLDLVVWNIKLPRQSWDKAAPPPTSNWAHTHQHHHHHHNHHKSSPIHYHNQHQHHHHWHPCHQGLTQQNPTMTKHHNCEIMSVIIMVEFNTSKSEYLNGCTKFCCCTVLL